jgi:hypothetical protein
MTDPITPPLELVQQWCHEDSDEIKTSPRWFHGVCAKAAQWGADQQLEQCVAWLDGYGREGWAAEQMRSDCRPKPPSLKEQALHELADAYNRDKIDDTTYDTIRRALENQ